MLKFWKKHLEYNNTNKDLIVGFDEEAYLEVNTDVKESIKKGQFRDARHHLATFGLSEIEVGIRKFHKDFDVFNENNYLYENSVGDEIKNTKYTSIFDHFCKVGYLQMLKQKKDTSFESKLIISEEESHEYYWLQNDERLDWKVYKNKWNVEDPILHFIQNWKVLFPVFEGFFDTGFYLEKYPDVNNAGINPLVQYLEKGINEGRKGFLEKDIVSKSKLLNDYQIYEYNMLDSFSLDWSHYFLDNNITQEDITDPIEHYLLFYKSLEPLLSNVFNTKLYYEVYQDIKDSNVNPLIHYLRHGKEEGRIGWIDFESHIYKGSQKHKKNIETLIIVTHESSATGAPLVSLNFAKSLCNKFNIINVILRKSNIHNDFLENCEYLIESTPNSIVISKIFDFFLKDKDILCVICNSVETFPVLKVAHELGLPTISLIHEFSDYTRPKGKMSETIFYADKIITPAKIITDSILNELQVLYGIKTLPNNIIVNPQGKLPYIPKKSGKNDSKEFILQKLHITDLQQTKIIVGAGFVHIRKGVDLFLLMASQMRQRYGKSCKFIWVGAGYNPDEDLEYSIWLKKQFNILKKDNSIIFLEHQKNLDNVLELADVFALTSRLDPFPNVVVDAMEKNVHISCFENSTGCSDFLLKNNANATIASYLDTSEMADNIINYLEKDNLDRTRNSSIVKDKLNFENYINDLILLAKEVNKINKDNEKITKVLLKEKEFNANFYNPEESEESACRMYVTLAKKGIYRFNPKPGFSEKEYIINNSSQVGLYHALVSKNKSTTHDMHIVDTNNNRRFDERYAIHLHLYYVDLAEEFAMYFSQLYGEFDLFITMVDIKKEKEVHRIFKTCGASNIFIIKVKNIGRDVVPLFGALKTYLFESRYSIVGHFHSKKSLDTNLEMGNNWRKFMMDTLVSNDVLSLFKNKQVGLVFPEDRHVVDFSENKQFSDELCTTMKIPTLNHVNIYPLGTMFWARIDALSPLFMINYNEFSDEEPLPYDGSYLHAIERLLPYVVSTQGYEFKTVHREGISW